MIFYIVIPAHNEQEVISQTLESLAAQTLLPKHVVVVNDNSTDNTQGIVETYIRKYSWLHLVNSKSSNQHLPGIKVINAFYEGFKTLDTDYDVICKFDADIILPKDYLERINTIFENNLNTGIAGGLAYVKKDNGWIFENIANKDHVRGPFKSYRKACFNDIGGLRPSIGWDTVDVLLAKYYGWHVVTDKTLHVKHLKPTGISYHAGSKHLQGEALYKMRYGFLITLISALKIAFKKRSFSIFRDYMQGFFKAKKGKKEFLVTQEQGLFIRKLRWKGMIDKF